jgi:hypothetical protein
MDIRTPNKIDLPDILSSKVGVIYVYYERKNEQKNQTNLAFFLKYALNNRIWQNIDIKYLFIINGYQCEVFIPERSDIDVLKEYNCHDWEAYANGIKFYEDKFNKKIWEIFDYLCLVNCSVLGPIYESSLDTHWLSPFYNKMKKDNAVACSPCMSFLPETDSAGVGPRLVSTFTFIKINEEIIDLLINTKISYCDETSINQDFITDEYYNTVLGVKYSKNDAICTGEYGLSRVLLKHNYNITSLLYDNINIYDKNNWSINNNIAPDRFNTFNGTNVPLSTVFIKNIWRWNDWYVSLPVLYDECMEFIYNKCNMTNIFSNSAIEYNYDLLYHKFYNNKSLKFDNIHTENIYNTFNRQEEVVLFNMSNINKNCAIYSHYDTDNCIKDYVIQGLKSLIYLGYDIIFLTTCKKIDNIDLLPFEIIYIENNKELKDWSNWLIGCSIIKQNNLNYEWILLLDNRILFPINGVEYFKKTVNEIRNQCDFWGHWDNCDILQLETPIEFKFKLLDYIINYIDNLLISVYNNITIEIDFISYLIQNGFSHKIIVSKLNLNIEDNKDTIYKPINLCQWLYDNNTFAVNWELCKKNLNLITLTPEFNYLTRYLHHE